MSARILMVWVMAGSVGAALPALAESAVKKTVDFSVTFDAGFGNEICVLGAHPQLGGGNPLRAPKLAWTPGNLWRGKIALEAGTSLTYQFVKRDFSTAAWPNSANAIPIGGEQTVTSPPHVAPPWGNKCVVYRTTFLQPKILFRDLTHGGPWTERTLQLAGPGQTLGEQTFRVDGLAPSGSEIEFVFHNGSGVYDNAPVPPASAPYAGMAPPYNYRTSLDVFMVKNGSVFNDDPLASPTDPRIETRQVASAVSGVPGRPIRILLPRGYDQNLRKRYPVVYFHDGQNVFSPGGPFGSWDADKIASHEISQGRMRETIVVSIPNGNDYGSERLREYLPDGDTLLTGGKTYTGNAAAYARFLLENVMPAVNANYRTQRDAPNTLTAGSSMGGLVSDYLGFTHPDRFGSIGILSPAYWTAPQWTARLDAAAKLPLRRFLYMGTSEAGGTNEYWRDALQAYDSWIKAGHAVNNDLRFAGGAGEAHNEAAWSRHLPAFFAFALDPWREANPLIQELFPPAIALNSLDLTTGRGVVSYMSLLGIHQEMLEGDNLQGWSVRPLPAATELWETREAMMPLPVPAPPGWFWRLRQDPWPGNP